MILPDKAYSVAQAAEFLGWTPGHSHNDALRIISKAILRDLWRAARTYHTGETE